MFQIPLATSSTPIPQDKFWDAVLLYHNRPNLVNRKITAVSQALLCEVCFKPNLLERLNRPSLLYHLRRLSSVETITEEFLKSLLEPYDQTLKLTHTTMDQFKVVRNGQFISLRVLYPRARNHPKAMEIVLLDKERCKVTCLAVSDTEKHFIAPPYPYQIELAEHGILKINVGSFEDADTAQAEWLADKLFTKLLKWVDSDDCDNKRIVPSLSLVKADEYCLTYNRLKELYGTDLVKKWPIKSGTDPQKYVFEDIAIASYLICLWKEDRDVRFIDCGCGNGLLVYLLNQEGYEGYGVDVRRRPIWDIYPPTTKLEVGTIGPNSTFPDTSWILGNHSDELTPWIPVLALKSNSNFFVLPCCPYDFNGQKFIRRNTSVSAYADYLDYIEEVSEKCGFFTEIDKLRIPSTKRTCLVGRETTRKTTPNKQQILKEIIELVEQKTAENFVQRSDTEKVRNCTKLERSLIKEIVQICVVKLLQEERHVEKPDGTKWNQGTQVRISELIKEIPSNTLKQLKQECGGLQTLLKNHRYIFKVLNGIISLQKPCCIKETEKYKDKPCWFLKNHPDGCFYDSSDCGYRHE
ncbi:probable tRNA (uracil-O(2)-)-methyltransferase [Anthonomus grandis grandis]|uniref:probable tRNA (uracil-O(2)-)-methyltransferase n=1 Tax=Anthonomus grandis grandis TaxID=2921223 RepID=UPI00216590A4|nr:probable tRNA (uracil-O(2)-)-methyltransferase [Anthonomus grandis grandis]XP_050302721.1 probable tRNA (uracil-O(2)-)-methyltransferase [Anthonomus grandis grandis]